MNKSIKITIDKQQIDVDYVHHFLSHSYWARGIPKSILIRSIEHSLCFTVLLDNRQIGFARVITDFSTFAYLADVFIDEAYRGRGYAKQLMEEIMHFPDLQGLRRWLLMTLDAHGLYRQYGFQAMAVPENAMEIAVRDIYIKNSI